jgi:sugar phosphate isomerase/epimerase
MGGNDWRSYHAPCKVAAMKPSAPVLKQFANLWTLSGQPAGRREWTLDEKFRRAKAAGFDAMGGGIGLDVAPLCQKHGLEYICYVNPNATNYASELEAASATRPARVNAQLCDHDTPPREAVRVWLKTEALATKMGLLIDLEVHRDTATETPEKVDEIARLYRTATGRDLRLCFDYSHFAVVKHLAPP